MPQTVKPSPSANGSLEVQVRVRSGLAALAALADVLVCSYAKASATALILVQRPQQRRELALRQH